MVMARLGLHLSNVSIGHLLCESGGFCPRGTFGPIGSTVSWDVQLATFMTSSITQYPSIPAFSNKWEGSTERSYPDGDAGELRFLSKRSRAEFLTKLRLTTMIRGTHEQPWNGLGCTENVTIGAERSIRLRRYAMLRVQA